MRLPDAHPAANAFPMMDRKRFDELREDIRANGQREVITLCDGMILDGRNRYKACLELGLKPRTQLFDGNPWSYAWSLNGARRDLVDEQRYLIWKFCAQHGGEWEAERTRIAEEANSKRSKATQARPRNSNGTLAEKPVVGQTVPLLVRDNHRGKRSKAAASRTNAGAVARGDKLAKQRPDLAEKVRKGEMKPAEAHRQMKRAEVDRKVAELPTGKFSVLYADPPWSYSDGRTGEGLTATGAQHHYPTMTSEELRALRIPHLAADNSVLFLWATSPLLPEALDLARAWGFKYKAAFVWDKVKHNMGHYNSVRHEFLLVCTKGSFTPQNVKLFDSVQTIERSDKHSEKPERFRHIIETLYPKGKKLELFRRGKTPQGWTAWGNEHE